MIEWNDSSRHSRDDKEKIPNEWTSKIGRIDVIIHRHIHYPKDTWLMSSRYLDVEKRVLKNNEDELAKWEAFNIAKHEIISKIAQLNEAFGIMMQDEVPSK